MSVGRQTQHHGNAARAGQSAGENLTTPRIGAVVADIAEQQRWSGAGALRQAGNGAELDVPIDLGVDARQFTGAVKRRHPTAQIAERHRLSFARH